jgi:hypothetical protein
MAKNLRAVVAYGQDLGRKGLSTREIDFATLLREHHRAFALWKARLDVTQGRGIAAAVAAVLVPRL